MINTSNEYKQYLNSVLPRDFTAKATITLADSTVLNIVEADIVKNGLKISDATSPSGSFQIGTAIINQCTLMLNNIGGKFNQYDFTDAIIRPYIGLKLSETTEWLKKGIFTVDEPTVASSVISLVALDNMNKFDTPFSDVTISFPCTQLQLLQAVCLHCGVYLTNATFTNSDFIITRRPNDEAITCREIVAWIAQNSGNFARCNTDGALELKWYDITAFEQSDSLDGGKFDNNTPYSTGDVADGGDFTFSDTDNYDGGTFLQMKKYHHIYALNQATIGTDDVIITGIQVKAQGTESDYGETVIFGTKGYMIEITNPLITENTASIIANSVGVKIVGMRFRPCNISALSDPSREAGDVAYLSHKNNTYQILLTNVSYQIGGNDSISCDAETPSKKQSVRFDANTKAIVEARKIAQEKLTEYGLAVKQLNSVMTNAMGYYPTSETQEDGSVIDYMHDKPTLAESEVIWKKSIDGFAVSEDGGQTWTSGFTSDGNIIAKTLSVIGINAEWINVLTSFTVGTQFSVDKLGKLIASNAEITGKITADSGKIGPYSITDTGLMSNFMKVFDNGMFPMLQLDRPVDEVFTYDYPVPGAQRGKYESSQLLLGAIDNDYVRTEVRVIARDESSSDESGLISIIKYNVSSEEVVSITRISDKGTIIINYEDGIISSKAESSATNGFLVEEYNYGTLYSSFNVRSDGLSAVTNGHHFNLIVSGTDGTVYLGGEKININGTEF